MLCLARPSSCVGSIKKNLTKNEIKQREEAEIANLSGIPIRIFTEVKKDKIAKIEFERVVAIMSAVNKNDALYEAVINDYCLAKSDIERYMKYRLNAEKDLKTLIKNNDMCFVEKLEFKDKLYKNIASYDKQIQSYQKKRFDIEKKDTLTAEFQQNL